ncbi:MAG TPA: hypothetical protein VHO84_02785, partial [Syntrophorhabdaceae bacterium]|nr:hypothetical protein [Syntrophorhabdaceae bacterium]
MPKSSMLVKEAGSSIAAALPEDGNTTSLDFTKMFNVSMNEGLKTIMDCIIVSDTAGKIPTDTAQTGGNEPVEDSLDEEKYEIPSVCLDTQSLIALFQAYFSAQDKQSAVKQPADDTGAGEFQNTCPKVQVDEFLQNVLHLLEQGDSVRITLKQIPIPIQEQKQNETVATVSYDNQLEDTEPEQAETQKDEIEVSEYHTRDFGPLQKMDAPENNPIFYRMAAVLEQMGQNIDKVTNESDGAGTQPIQYKISYEYSGDRPQVESSRQDEQSEGQMSIETQQPFVNTDKMDNTKEDDTKPLYQTKAIIEIMKPI